MFSLITQKIHDFQIEKFHRFSQKSTIRTSINIVWETIFFTQIQQKQNCKSRNDWINNSKKRYFNSIQLEIITLFLSIYNEITQNYNFFCKIFTNTTRLKWKLKLMISMRRYNVRRYVESTIINSMIIRSYKFIS